MSQTIFFGPPGTGKTETLLNKVMEELDKGVPPAKIAFVSFTRKAAHEAAKRACEKFGFMYKDLPYFKTLHSLAFKELGLRQDSIASHKDLHAIGDTLGLAFSQTISPDEPFYSFGKELGDKYALIENLSRTRDVTLEQQWRESKAIDGVDYLGLKQFAETYARYKNDRGLLDYSDMLGRKFMPLDVEVLVIDEAQDLSNLQWRFILNVFGNVHTVYMAGDDDQSIYAWAGADVSLFLDAAGERIVLEKSHRVPKNIFPIADAISRRIKRRQPKTWGPRDDAGHLERVQHPDDVDFSNGTWLLLARNLYMLQQLQKAVQAQGHVYICNGQLSVRESHLRAIKEWEQLRQGGILNMQNILCIYEWLGCNVAREYRLGVSLVEGQTYALRDLVTSHGVNTVMPWFVALDGIPGHLRDYYLPILQRGDEISNPRININTIHGVKGGEAENVLLMTDMSPRVYEEYLNDPDNEHRVFYVGATRAKNALYIVEPQTNLFYDI